MMISKIKLITKKGITNKIMNKALIEINIIKMREFLMKTNSKLIKY